MSKKIHYGPHGKYGFIACGAKYYTWYTSNPERVTCGQCKKHLEQLAAKNKKG